MHGNSKRILIIDDDEAVRRLLKRLLESDYRLAEAARGEEALEILPSFQPHLVMLDIMLPGIDGHETCRRLRSGPLGRGVQVVMMSAKSSREEQLRAYQAGADDYLVKPFDPNELRSRVHLHLRLRGALDTIVSTSDGDSRRGDAKERDATVAAMMAMAEFRDTDTGGHLLRMRRYSQVIAEDLARHGPYADQCDAQFLADLYRASPLHDVGKIGISDSILLKPGHLTPEEFESMKQHTIIGANLLKHVLSQAPWVSFLPMAVAVARFHHERFDGSGYLAGLAGMQIPLPARIVALADAFDAITAFRPYKAALPAAAAKKIVERDSGRHFDPVVVEAFRRCFDTIVHLQEPVPEPFAVVSGANSFLRENLLAAGG